MKMTEFDVSAVDLSGVLNTSPEEKAKQVPDPATYHLLCMLPKAEDEYSETGILKSATAILHEELLSPVLFVAKIGPDAFKDEKRFPSGAACQVGDFVLVRPNTGTRMKIHGTEWRLINDDSVQAVVQDPRGIQRPN
jgi:co-chaperonin GroES (HSP10)